MYYKRIFIFLSCCILNALLVSAQTGELHHVDCSYAKEIIVPFNYAENVAQKAQPNLNQTVFYSYRDQFSYWYKIIVKENATLSFKVAAINDSDDYAVYVYQYNADDFCNKVYNQKIRPAKSSFFNGGAKDNPYDLSEKKFSAQKDNVYYISVLNTSLNNCGHTFYLTNTKDTLKVKALHLPCKRDITTLLAKAPILKTDSQLTIKAILKTDTAKVVVAKNTLVVLVKDALKKTSVDAKLIITEQTSGNAVEVNTINKGEYNFTFKKDKIYTVKCSAFGYKSIEQTIDPNINNKVDVFMEMLKTGDSFIMKSIYFHPNTYALKRESQDELQKLLAYLLNNKNIQLEIQGHTSGDNRISKNKAYKGLGDDWNFSGSAKKLSQKRAEAIVKYLTSNGVAANRLSAKGYGGQKMIIKKPRTNEEAQKNIRVEVVVLKS